MSDGPFATYLTGIARAWHQTRQYPYQIGAFVVSGGDLNAPGHLPWCHLPIVPGRWDIGRLLSQLPWDSRAAGLGQLRQGAACR